MNSTSARKKSGGFWESVRTVLYAVIIALVVRTLAYEPFSIPSASMQPNLLIGDYLFVSKFTYGYSRFSLPYSVPLFEDRILMGEGPARGDIAVFRLPSDTKTDFIKRVIGLPGDEIQVQRGRLYINGEPVERELVDGAAMLDGRPVPGITEYIETLPNGISYRIWEETDNGFFDNTPVYQVPEGHYFMMGDNRDHSQDSRAIHQVGFVPAQNFIGPAEFLFFSHDPAKPLWPIDDWIAGIRVDRIFDALD